MLIRLRSRDGLERVEVPESGTVGDLRQAIHTRLGVPLEGMRLSQQPELLTPAGAPELGSEGMLLRGIGLGHGAILFLAYPGERAVAGPPRGPLEGRPFGAHMDVARMVAAQTRIERQESAAVAAASFDSHALNAFQSYVSSALAFSIKRGGILYGTVEEGEAGEGGAGGEGKDGKADGEAAAASRVVFVHAIYEPPQSGSADSLVMESEGEDAARADALAAALGWRRVGIVFNQAAGDRDFILSETEVCAAAAVQAALGDAAVTALVAAIPDEDAPGGVEVHVEAFQVSAQCVKLWREGWFASSPGASGVSALRDPRDPKAPAPVIVAGKDVGEVDNDWFLVPLPIRDHAGPLETAFPVENRLLPRGRAELRDHLRARAGKPYVQRVADFHLLLYLAEQPSIERADADALAAAVRDGTELGEGYALIVDSLAGI